MNQIIYPEKIEYNLINYNNILLQKKKIYRNLFVLSLVLLFLFLIYYITQYIHLLNKEKIHQKILSIYDVQQLYKANTFSILPSITLENVDSADVLGILQIDKINLRYPILSKSTKDFLKISVCKFYGNTLNDFGNFCIVGHNYDNEKLFSNLNKLELGDNIIVYNLNRF